MKLMNNFFEVLNSSKNDNGFISTIKLNPNHIVYTGHFPGHPVTPGVIQMQIVHELIEQHLDRKLKLRNMPQCKFLKILNPNETTQIDIHIDYEHQEEIIKIKAIGKSESDIYFNFRAILA